MGYRLINHAGCWQNTRGICKSRAAGELFTNSSKHLRASKYSPTVQDLCLKSPVTHGNFCQQMSKLAALPMALCLVNAHVPLCLVNAYVPTNLIFAAVPCKFLMKRFLVSSGTG